VTELARAFDFVAYADMHGTRSEPTRFGIATLTPDLPLRHDSNYLRVDRLPADVTAAQVAADADRALAGIGLSHRVVMARDEETGERLAPGFAALGWEVSRSIVMALHRPSERQADLTLVSEVDAGLLAAPRMRQIQTYPWGSEEVARQLVAAKQRIPARTRFFAALDGGEPVSWADLYVDEGTAQIEDVATLEPYRGRGLASAVVLRAVHEARSSGAQLVFLVADADDWPQELYGRLGFDEIGRYLKFLLISDRPDETPPAVPAA
jgi:ribosomal protein S18 acetylase RimI-like enzyme